MSDEFSDLRLSTKTVGAGRVRETARRLNKAQTAMSRRLSPTEERLSVRRVDCGSRRTLSGLGIGLINLYAVYASGRLPQRIRIIDFISTSLQSFGDLLSRGDRAGEASRELGADKNSVRTLLA